jgi:hypothetical protein
MQSRKLLRVGNVGSFGQNALPSGGDRSVRTPGAIRRALGRHRVRCRQRDALDAARVISYSRFQTA